MNLFVVSGRVSHQLLKTENAENATPFGTGSGSLVFAKSVTRQNVLKI